MIQSRKLETSCAAEVRGARMQRLCRAGWLRGAATAIWGYSVTTLSRDGCSWLPSASGGRCLGHFLHPGRWWGLPWLSPASGRAELSALPHAGGAARLPKFRSGTAAEAGSAGRCLGARHSADGMDLRSAGKQELVFQHREAGRDRPSVFSGFLWCILGTSAGGPPDGSSARGVVDGLEPCTPGVAGETPIRGFFRPAGPGPRQS